MTIVKLFLGLALILASFDVRSQGCEGPPAGVELPEHGIVYTRLPRHSDPVANGAEEGANWQIWAQDVGRIWYAEESDLVLDNLEGQQIVLHDCTTSSTLCSAQTPRVSPNGLEIAYTVLEGNAPGPFLVNGLTNKQFNAVRSNIWIYNLVTGTSHKVTTNDYRQKDPEWCGDNCLMFATERGGPKFAPMSIWNTGKQQFYPMPSLSIFRAKRTVLGLTEYYNLTPESVFALSPMMGSSGQMCYTDYIGWSPKPDESVWDYHRDRGSTPQNYWKVTCKELDGTGHHAELNAHAPTIPLPSYQWVQDWSDPQYHGERSSVIQSPRPVAETHVGKLKAGSYYRAQLAGTIVGWDTDWEVSEGDWGNPPGSMLFRPQGIRDMTPYAVSQDQFYPRKHKETGKAAGRTQFPAPWVGDFPGFLYSHCRGHCYKDSPHTANAAAMGGEPTAKWEIRLALGPYVDNPFDLNQSRAIACTSLDYHCLDARAVDSYENIMGIPFPTVAEVPTEGACFVDIENAKEGELLPHPSPEGSSPKKRVGTQGNSVDPDAYRILVKSIGLYYTPNWQETATDVGFPPGGGMQTIPIAEDGSASAQVFCDVPFMHFGLDAQGKKIATGHDRLAVRKGDTMTCKGCHLGHATQP